MANKYRQPIRGKANRKNFNSGLKTPKVNVRPLPTRGGYAL